MARGWRQVPRACTVLPEVAASTPCLRPTFAQATRGELVLSLARGWRQVPDAPGPLAKAKAKRKKFVLSLALGVDRGHGVLRRRGRFRGWAGGLGYFRPPMSFNDLVEASEGVGAGGSVLTCSSTCVVQCCGVCPERCGAWGQDEPSMAAPCNCSPNKHRCISCTHTSPTSPLMVALGKSIG